VTYQFTPLVITFVINACIAVVFALFGWSRRLNPGGRYFAFLMLAIGVWSLSFALEMAAVDRVAKIFWAETAYFGIASTGPLWLLFAAGFARKGPWFTNKRLMLLAAIPAATVVLAFTNDFHRLIWTSIGPGGNSAINLYLYRHGPWFWVIVAYNYTAMLIGTVLLLRAFRHYTRLYRLQAVLVVIGALLPMTGNALYIVGLSPVPGLDLTHFGFTPSALIFSLTVFRYKMFDLRSFARDIAVEKMSDGFIVMDDTNRIIDLNPAAAELFGSPGFLALGMNVEEAAVRWSEMTSVLDDANRSHLEIILGDQTYKIHLTPVADRAGYIRGRVLFIVDVTQ
jgi:PAS domain-containing protein